MKNKQGKKEITKQMVEKMKKKWQNKMKKKSQEKIKKKITHKKISKNRINWAKNEGKISKKGDKNGEI